MSIKEYTPKNDKIIYVASHNEQKLKAVYDAFRNYFDDNLFIKL